MTDQIMTDQTLINQGTTDQAARAEFHPRWYRKRLSTWWWLGEWHYLTFILRELSSLSVAWFVVLTLFQLRALSHGLAAYLRFTDRLESPVMITLNAIAFCFVMFHTITWFNLAPRAMPVRMGGKRVPEFLVAAPNYVLWIAVSAFVAWLLLRTP
jgi:fumarate reductase subunit C